MNFYARNRVLQNSDFEAVEDDRAYGVLDTEDSSNVCIGVDITIIARGIID